jgi:hypothetical protein
MLQQLGDWAEIRTCYENKNASSRLIVEKGKVGSRWLFSVSCFLSMCWIVMEVPMERLVERAKEIVEENLSHHEKLMHQGNIVQLGSIMDKNGVGTRELYIQRMRSDTIFMYSFMMIREKEGTRYRPYLKEASAVSSNVSRGVQCIVLREGPGTINIYKLFEDNMVFFLHNVCYII